MKEFVEKLKDMIEEKIKVTSLEIIVTGTKDKPYFEIKYKEVGKEDYNIGYSSYDLNNVFGWKEKCFEIVKLFCFIQDKQRMSLYNSCYEYVSENVLSIHRLKLSERRI